jgi:hypothetical protein
MTSIYKIARAAYKAGEFTNFNIRVEDDGAALVYRDGKFVQLFPSRLLAEREIAAAQAKASKFIQ